MCKLTFNSDRRAAYSFLVDEIVDGTNLGWTLRKRTGRAGRFLVTYDWFDCETGRNVILIARRLPRGTEYPNESGNQCSGNTRSGCTIRQSIRKLAPQIVKLPRSIKKDALCYGHFDQTSPRQTLGVEKEVERKLFRGSKNSNDRPPAPGRQLPGESASRVADETGFDGCASQLFRIRFRQMTHGLTTFVGRIRFPAVISRDSLQ